MTTVEKIKHLESEIYEKQTQIEFNIEESKKGIKPIFNMKWNQELAIEIEAFENQIEKYKESLTLISA